MKDTEIILVLDRSGSMSGVRGDTIGGVNTFIDDQKKEEGNATMTLRLFDNEHGVVFESRNIQDVQHLTESDFVPRGGTALLDAIGRAIAYAEEKYGKLDEDSRPNILINIITDGQENQSTEFSLEVIRKKVEEKRAAGWEFIFLSADISTFSVGASMGISNNVAYSKSSTGASISAYSASVRTLRRTGKLDEDQLDVVNAMYLNSVDNSLGTTMVELQGLKATAKAATTLDPADAAAQVVKGLAEKLKSSKK